MSVTVTKSDGVSVLTVTSDPKSVCPPVCQVLRSLCYSPEGCSVSQQLRRLLGSSQSLLGALHITAGLLHVALGAILLSLHGVSLLEEIWFPFWVAAVFILCGIVCILSEKFPTPCLVIFNVILNSAGVLFAIAAIVLYSFNAAYIEMSWICHNADDFSFGTTTPSPSPRERFLMERCKIGEDVSLMLMRAVNIVVIIVSFLQLCLAVSSSVLGIKALRSRETGDDKIGDPELCKPLLQEVSETSTA
ncbi:membrane-spanning 4-domains subfamily A member 15-like [Centropristis striata]|uniref:membrane-spanning 4-domains subfamily A member 15-like n=1 Tax=Centropristis striata TaxID=184440 RepID=UPI0027E1DAAD|nr:membrane-spanning 4-domains subfamily A member 15-like [Centropristis striata]